MKKTFKILIFIFISVSAFGQTDSLICGEYRFVEKKGVHFWTNEYDFIVESYCDTVVFIILHLEKNHTAYFSNDTMLNPNSMLYTQFPKTFIGSWAIENDELIIQYDERWTYKSRRLSSYDEQIIIKEKLSTPMTQKFSFRVINDSFIRELNLVNESRNLKLELFIEE
jgi:hypothetical protein